MSTSLIPSVLTALCSLLDTALAIEVYDGPVTTNLETAGLLVGATGITTEAATIGWEQNWAGQGHASRNEDITVPCFLFVRSGDQSLSDARTSLFGYFATIENLLRTTPTLGISTNTIRAQLVGETFAQTQTGDGVTCSIQFNIEIKGRI